MHGIEWEFPGKLSVGGAVVSDVRGGNDLRDGHGGGGEGSTLEKGDQVHEEDDRVLAPETPGHCLVVDRHLGVRRVMAVRGRVWAGAKRQRELFGYY